jgi:tetratricopeptide (TPR) repeat protein
MIQPSDFLATVARAELRTASGDWPEAAALWAQVTAANPVNGDYWARLAEARFAGEEYAAADQAYQKVLELGIRATHKQQFREDRPELLPGEVAYRIACCRAALAQRDEAAPGQRDEALGALAAALDRGFRDLDRAQDDQYWKPWHGDERLEDLLGLIDPDGMTRDQGWRADLRLLAREIKRRAYAPFALVPEVEFDRSVARLDHDIPGLTDAQILVGMMKLVRHLDDGHAGVRPPAKENKNLSRLLPLDLFLFPEGLFVIAAGPGHDHLLGAEIEKIGRHTVADAIAALDPVIVRDNEQQVTFMAPWFLRYTAVLQGLGIIDDLTRASLTIRGTDGTSQELTLDAGPGDHLWDRYPPGWTALADTVPGQPRPLHLRHRDLPYWFEYLPAHHLVYFQYNAVRDHPAEPFAAFCDRLFGFIEDRRPGRLVIDLRWNGGGNTFLAQPLLHHLIACPATRRRGALFVIVGRQTFSAAQNTATAIDRETDAIFVGEPTGSRPNFIGETSYFELPYSKVRANAADLFWQTSWPEDHRTWIAPDIYVPPTFAAFSRNEDPALDAILALREQFPGP